MADSGPTPADVRTTSLEICRIRPKSRPHYIDRSWAILAESWPALVDSGPNLVESGRVSHTIGRTRPKFGRFRASSAGVGRSCPPPLSRTLRTDLVPGGSQLASPTGIAMSAALQRPDAGQRTTLPGGCDKVARRTSRTISRPSPANVGQKLANAAQRLGHCWPTLSNSGLPGQLWDILWTTPGLAGLARGYVLARVASICSATLGFSTPRNSTTLPHAGHNNINNDVATE